jgi:uncharacterized protein YdaU (DUF1376 family)
VSKQPFLPLFFGDFSASTAEWRGEEASLYLTLLGHQWAIGSLPADPEKLCRLVRWDRKLFNQCWPTVSAKFQPVGDGRLGNSRLEDHRERAKELAKKNADAGRKGAESRWRKDGERHSDGIDSAIIQPMPGANGATHSNPSHPIPIHTKSRKEERARKRAASSIPEDWQAGPDLDQFATERLPNVSLSDLWLAFTDYHSAKGTTSKDWSASARTWVANAAKFGYPMVTPAERPREKQIRFDANGRLME